MGSKYIMTVEKSIIQFDIHAFASLTFDVNSSASLNAFFSSSLEICLK